MYIMAHRKELNIFSPDLIILMFYLARTTKMPVVFFESFK